MMRASGWLAVAVVLGSQPACDQVRDFRNGDSGRLSLSLEAPETLDWGGTGTIRLALQNQGSSATEGATVEVHLPAWLEFGSVEPAGTEVTLLTSDGGTRLSYRLNATLEAGERREIVQHVRVPAAGPAPGATPATTGTPAGTPGSTSATTDTTPGGAAAPAATRPPPTDRVMRARLVSPGGDVLGAEVQAVLAFRGATDAGLPQTATTAAPDSVIGSGGVGGVRLGMSADDLRRDIPGARDTMIDVPGGGQERAVLLPIGGNRSLAAIVSARGVEQIVVRDAGFSTERGLGVGARLSELRAVYGAGCAEPFGARRVAVRFDGAPGVVFALSAAAPADTARLRTDASMLPDTARVTELWVSERRNGC